MTDDTLNASMRTLAMQLLSADTEAEVIEALTKAGYWTNASCWRDLGDRDGNFSTIGNQQARPEAALVEKVVNAVDARLLGECLRRGVDPQSTNAPASIRDAVAELIAGKPKNAATGGGIDSWTQKQQLEQARKITIAVTGHTPRQGMPCITIADTGEGQSPKNFPDTFLSIDKSNKLRIPFVQGKFNMGGTGALKFCGRNGLQLLISRRDPAIEEKWGNTQTRWAAKDPRVAEWGFTVVRRERPTGEQGQVRNSVYRYLAPTDGSVLSFASDELPIFPEGNRAYARTAKHGTVIKLYEYDTKGFSSQALMKGGLLSRLEALLPSIALPARVHECRKYGGDADRSFENSLVGLSVRLNENRGANLEDGYPTSSSFVVRQEKMTAQIFAFKEDKAESYRTNEGVIFTVNGQTHGSIPKTFFERNRVKMGRLSKSIIVVVDCSELTVSAREDLFMNSRDRLSAGELRKDIEEELESIVRNHEGLRQLQARRRSEEIASRMENSKPLEQILDSILKSSPSLSRLFKFGQRLSTPLRADTLQKEEGGGQGRLSGQGDFAAKTHPTYFRFHNRHDGERLTRNAEIDRRCRIKFDTDAPNDYFEREVLAGRYVLDVLEGSVDSSELNHSCSVFQGVANWSVKLPKERVAVGDVLTIQCTVYDETRQDPFVSVASLTVVASEEQPGKGGKGQRDSNSSGGSAGTGGTGPSGKGGNRGSQGKEDQGGISLPPIVQVARDSKQWQLHGFEEETACRVIEDDEGFSFYINVDNIYLRTDMKDKKSDAALVKSKFIWGNVLVGLALLHQDRAKKAPAVTDEIEGDNVNVRIGNTTDALAPFLLPMIDYLGSLSEEDVANAAQRGDEE